MCYESGKQRSVKLAVWLTRSVGRLSRNILKQLLDELNHLCLCRHLWFIVGPDRYGIFVVDADPNIRKQEN